MIETTDLSQTLDQMLARFYAPDQPGAAVIAVKDGQTLFRKGYGMANLELGVPLAADMVFRIGSVTKQFTAVAILMLMEQGKLGLDDPIEKFLPDYPTHGHSITIRHLLTHTSGIQSYTDMPAFEKAMTNEMTTDEMLAFFKNQPMHFAPGKAHRYNNSGFYLLGVIIEKVSGMPYAEFLQKHIFDPLEMRQTCYDSPTRIIPRRACGYEKKEGVYINAPYLSMSQPYAAGALASTVDDLARWDAALYTGRLVQPETLERAWTPTLLADGKPVQYGFGWALASLAGMRTIEHGGGINGFLSYVLRVPDARLFVAVLSNNIGGCRPPEEIAVRVAAQVLGQPVVDPVPVPLAPEMVARLLGIYRKDKDETWTMAAEDGKYLIKWPNDYKMEILPISETEFVAADHIFIHACFHLSGDGPADTLELRGRSGPGDVARREG